MSRNRELRRLVHRVSWGVIDTLAFLLLSQLAFGVAMVTTVGPKSSATAARVRRHADQIEDSLMASFDPQQLRSAWGYLKRKGLITAMRGKLYEASVTARGRTMIKDFLPTYQKKRPWDHRIYLITYDVEEEDRRTRQELFSFLKSIRCAPLQKSTFLSVYNPRALIREWVSTHRPMGDLLVSDLGPDGALGDRPLEELVSEAYDLPRLNAEYDAFLRDHSASDRSELDLRTKSFFHFTSILTSDPQLPFELLPHDWLGEEAYERYRAITSERR